MYRSISEAEVPEAIRWDVPRINQGQIVEVAYADARPLAGEADVGSLFRRTLDRSDRSVTYAVRAGTLETWERRALANAGFGAHQIDLLAAAAR